MRRSWSVLLLLVAVGLAALTVLPVAYRSGVLGQPSGCDSYGDCISLSIVYDHSNPDHTLYLGDDFDVIASVSLGGGATGYSLGWSYDSSAFQITSSGDTAHFLLIANDTATTNYTITANLDVTVVVCTTVTLTGTNTTTITTTSTTGTNTSTITSTSTTTTTSTSTSCTTIESVLSASVTVTAIPFVLNLTTQLQNVTCSAGCLLRNADGTFYRGDAFSIGWNATFQFDAQRSDITVNVTSAQIPQLAEKLTSSLPRGLGGAFLYNVTTSHPYSLEDVRLVAEAYNYLGQSLGLRASIQGYAVVQYKPMFTYISYMDYNYLNSSAYQRPFVTLVRFGGNQPGYTSPGGLNWTPFNALNATGERAYVDNFTFSTTGWNTSLVGTASNEAVNYTSSSGVMAGTILLNNTNCHQEFTWGNRVQKYYFENTNVTANALKDTIYFNTTMSAWSQDFPFVGNHQFLFNTSYLQEPVLYNGYVIFQTYDAAGKPDPAVSNIVVKVTNPQPLDPYLVSDAVKVFGNDSRVIAAFDRDLYPASATMTLAPIQQGNGRWVYLVNETNVSLNGNLSLPIYSVTVSGVSSGATYDYSPSIPFVSYLGPGSGSTPVNYTYTFQGSFSLDVANKATTGSPFDNMTMYFMDQRGSLVLRPLNFTSYPQVVLYFLQSLDTLTPYTSLTTLPGGAALQYMFILGTNTTIPVNIQGGIGGLAAPLIYKGGTEFQVTLMVGASSGGGVDAWVSDQSGVLVNETLPDTWPTISSWAPPGFTGLQTLLFEAPSGDSNVTLHLLNSWGGVAVVTIAIPSVPASSPLDGTVLITAVFLLTMGFYFLGEVNRRVGTRR